MKLRRSTSEPKVEKDRRNNEERANKSKSVHFDGSENHLAAASSSISIIGKPPKNSSSNPNLARDSKTLEFVEKRLSRTRRCCKVG